MTDGGMFWRTAAWELAATGVVAACVWAASVRSRDVSIVDIAWGWLVLTPAAVCAALLWTGEPRAIAVLVCVALWALRLSVHIAWRHHGHGEDRRYQVIRARNQPHFEWKSLYLVFGLQAVLAWVVAQPVVAAVTSGAPWGSLDAAGFALYASGLAIEVLADAQLARFRGDPAQAGRVMDRGLWRYSRHPNYFGEFCIWWGLWLVAASTGSWWTIASPLLMSFLLLKVSGVILLEKDIALRRPAYADYVQRTNAFFPGKPRG